MYPLIRRPLERSSVWKHSCNSQEISTGNLQESPGKSPGISRKFLGNLQEIILEIILEILYFSLGGFQGGNEKGY